MLPLIKVAGSEENPGMKSKLIVIVTSLVLAASLSKAGAAEPPGWLLKSLKVADPGQLAVRVHASERCPFTVDNMKSLVSTVIFRKQIKPLTDINHLQQPLYLNVSMQCLKLPEGRKYQTYQLSIRYGVVIKGVPVLIDQSYGFLGVDDEEGMITTVKTGIESAITDFRTANFGS